MSAWAGWAMTGRTWRHGSWSITQGIWRTLRMERKRYTRVVCEVCKERTHLLAELYGIKTPSGKKWYCEKHYKDVMKPRRQGHER